MVKLLDAHEEATEEGRAEGLQKGIEQNLAKGHTEGENAAKLAIARKMKNAQRPIDEIAAFTGLPLETIEQIG